MILKSGRFCLLILASLFLSEGCALQERNTAKQLSAVGLIATPPSQYSTQKARYLGDKYKENLNRIVEKIIASPKTANLQFANNIASAGGIGFFTHSAVKSPDERYLEVVLGAGENLASKSEYSANVTRLFSLYGKELLEILASDLDMYNDRELSGYGLNFIWRTAGPRLVTERIIIYFPKERVNAFLKQDLNEDRLLADAVIFAMGQEGQAKLVSFRVQEPAPDVRAPIQEQVLSPEPNKPSHNSKPLLARPESKVEQRNKPRPSGHEKVGEAEGPAVQSGTISNTTEPKVKMPVKEQIVAEQKVPPVPAEKAQPVTLGSIDNVVPRSNKPPMHSTGVSKSTQPAPPEAGFLQPPPEAKATQSMPQSGSKQEKAFNSGISVDQAKEKEEIELRSGITASRLKVPIGESEGKQDSKADTTIEKAPEPETIAMLPSSPEELKPGNEVEQPAQLATIPKVSFEPAKKETPALITRSKPEELKTEPAKQKPELAHEKAIDSFPEITPIVRSVPKALEGYIIQVPFNDRSQARYWADTFEQRGYAVSITEAGGAESLRVRIGNFRLRDEAERKLKSIREDGLMGIILNLPQAYRPEVRSSLP